jgi:ABC-type uncharacterized transport system ATPase subunit
VLAGQRPKQDGNIYIHGKDFDPTREEIREHKVRCLPEEPLRNACVPTMTIAENLAFHDFDRPPNTVARWGVSRAALDKRARGLIADYGVRARGPETPIGTLSGGNVQRVVLARELSSPLEVLIVANPCMGLDFAAVAEIHGRIRKAREGGAAVLLVSADLDEVLALADRVLVMSEGRVVYETPIDKAEVAVIGQHMAGHRQHTAAAEGAHA